MQPKETDSGAGTGVSREEKVGPIRDPGNGGGRDLEQWEAQCSPGWRQLGRQVRSVPCLGN